jgi:hypothetical protein
MHVAHAVHIRSSGQQAQSRAATSAPAARTDAERGLGTRSYGGVRCRKRHDTPAPPPTGNTGSWAHAGRAVSSWRHACGAWRWTQSAVSPRHALQPAAALRTLHARRTSRTAHEHLQQLNCMCVLLLQALRGALKQHARRSAAATPGRQSARSSAGATCQQHCADACAWHLQNTPAAQKHTVTPQSAALPNTHVPCAAAHRQRTAGHSSPRRARQYALHAVRRQPTRQDDLCALGCGRCASLQPQPPAAVRTPAPERPPAGRIDDAGRLRTGGAARERAGARRGDSLCALN